MKITILYEDNHLLIVEKPVNIPVQADQSGDKDFLNMLKEDIKLRHHKPGNVFLGLVHRLDRPVGGVMVFAKTSKAASRLSNEIRKQALERRYTAVVRGIPEKMQGTLEHYLVKNQQKNQVHVVSEQTKDAKKAILDYQVVQSVKGLSVVKVKLHTGRSHQIRVQMKAMGTPIYGDQKYGQSVNKPGQQIALWASHLSVKHPTKDEIISIDCPPPKQYPWNIS